MIHPLPLASLIALSCSCSAYEPDPAQASPLVTLPPASGIGGSTGDPTVTDAPTSTAARDLGGLEGGAISGEVARRDAARKVVRSGQVSVIVGAWEPFEQDLRRWLAEHGGHLSELSLDRWAGRVGHGAVTIQVPTDELDPLLSWTAETVEISHLALHSEDVTTQWIDVEARLVTSRQTEARLLALLEEETADLAEVLAAERELGRIRGEVEAFERQQRALATRVQLANLSVDVSVRQAYAPLVERPLAEELGAAWSRSLAALAAVGRGLLLLGVFSLPWLAMLGAGGLALLGGIRLVIRRARR